MVNRDNVVVGSVLLLLAVGYGYMTSNLPTRNMANTLGMGFMPWIFAMVLALLSITLIVLGLLGKAVNTSRADQLSLRAILGVGLVFVIFAIYIALIDTVGFLIVTPLMVFALMYFGGARSYRKMIGLSVAVTVVVYGLFRYVFEVTITGIAFL